MSIFDMFPYFITLVAIAVAPGPLVLMLLVRAASNDIPGAVGFGIGFSIGGVLIISAVCFGLSTWITAVPENFGYIKFIMMAYILWIARGLWWNESNASDVVATERSSIGSSVVAGLFTCFISPYMMILFPLVVPELLDISIIKIPEFLIIASITFLAFASGAAVVIGFAAQLRRFARSARSMQIINRILASGLVLGGSWMALT